MRPFTLGDIYSMADIDRQIENRVADAMRFGTQRERVMAFVRAGYRTSIDIAANSDMDTHTVSSWLSVLCRKKMIVATGVARLDEHSWPCAVYAPSVAGDSQ